MKETVLQIDHGPRVRMCPDTMDRLVAAGRMDPEFQREDVKRLLAGLAPVRARFQPGSPPPVAAAPYPGAVVNPLGPPTISGTTFSIDIGVSTRVGF